MVEDKPRTQEDKPGVQAEAELPGEIAMVRYRKDSQFLLSCSVKEFFDLTLSNMYLTRLFCPRTSVFMHLQQL